jgi:hypothetical protein
MPSEDALARHYVYKPPPPPHPDSPMAKKAQNSKNPAVVSDYAKFYGTYSGADIKVVVHYPHDPIDDKLLLDEMWAIEKEAIKAEIWYENNREILTTKQLADYIQAQQVRNSELSELDAILQNIRNLPTSKTLGDIQTISIGSFRDKAPVRPLGAVYPRAYTRGPRTISGSMVFTIFHEHVFADIMRLKLRQFSTGSSDFDNQLYTTMLADQMPPIDISLVFANEYGAISHMGLWGVEFFQEGQTFSIEDIYSENVVQYVARDLDPMRLVETRAIDGHGVSKSWNKTASDLMKEQMFSAHIRRRNPFI